MTQNIPHSTHTNGTLGTIPFMQMTAIYHISHFDSMSLPSPTPHYLQWQIITPTVKLILNKINILELNFLLFDSFFSLTPSVCFLLHFTLVLLLSTFCHFMVTSYEPSSTCCLFIQINSIQFNGWYCVGTTAEHQLSQPYHSMSLIISISCDSFWICFELKSLLIMWCKQIHQLGAQLEWSVNAWSESLQFINSP